MHILTILRLVPDTREELPFEGAEIDRDDTDIMLNEFDDYALEEAVLLKEATGGTVTALGMPGDGIDRILQTAVARGADRAVRLDCGDADHFSSRDLSGAFAAMVEALKPDVILTGVQTPEDMFGQLVPHAGEALGWPHASGITTVTPASDSALRIQQEYGGGKSAILKVDLPVILGIQSSSRPPRYVAGSKLRDAIKTTNIEALEIELAEVAALAGATITALSGPEQGKGAAMYAGDAEDVAEALYALLFERGLVEERQ